MKNLLALLAISYASKQIHTVRVDTSIVANLSFQKSLHTDEDEENQLIDTGPHMFSCEPDPSKPPAKVSDTKQMKAVLSGVKKILGISSTTWVIGINSAYFVAGVHGTTTFALANMLKNGIKVSPEEELRATGRSLLSEGFYMYSMGWGYEGETAQGISHMIKELNHYCKEAKQGLRRATGFRAPSGRAPHPAKQAAMEALAASKKAGKGDSWTDKVIIFLGAHRKLGARGCNQGLSLRSDKCAENYQGAKQRQDQHRYVYFGEIPEEVGYVVGPKIVDQPVELVAKRGLASNLVILGYHCVDQGIYVKHSKKLANLPPHCFCSRC